MPNPLDHLYDELKVKYPDFVDRGEFVSKLSNEDELKKLHQAATQSFKGFVGFDDFKNKVGESLSTYDTDSDYRTQNTASTEQKSAEADNTASQREESRPAPSEPQNSGIESEASVPDGPTDTSADAEAFDRETGDLDELGRRYQEKVKRLEGYGATEGLYANEEAARKHYEAYTRLLDEAEQDRLVYNRRVKAAEDERAEQQRQLDLQSKDRKTRRSAEYGGYTNDQVRKEQERLKKERAYLEDPKSKRNADYSKRVMEYNADQTALSGEADKRNKSYERKRAMYDEVKTIAEDPDVQKRITGNDMVSYVLSGNNTYATQNYDAYLRGAKMKSVEELADTCKTIAGQVYARGDNKDVYAPLASCFMANYYELMYRMGGDEPKSAMEMRYDMIDKATEGTPEGDNFMLGLRNYLDGTAGMGTQNYETDDSERANIPQFAVVDNYKNLVSAKKQENTQKVAELSRLPQVGYGGSGTILDGRDMQIFAAAADINYDDILQQAFDEFGEDKLKEYIVAHSLRNGISTGESARRVYQFIWNETIGKEIEESRPKSGAEFFMRRITSDNMFGKLIQLGIRGYNGNLVGTDPFAINTMVLDEYAKEHPGWDTAAVVTNFAVMEGPIFSGYGKIASGLVGATERAVLGAALKTTDRVAIEATARTLSQSLMYRLAKGGATGALVGFQYGTMSGAIDQAYYNGDVDFGKVIANGGHMMRDFALMHGVGEVFGVTGDAILRRGQRNLRNGQGALRNRIETTSLHFLNNVAKTTTNASIVTGLYAAIDKPALERENKKIEAENKKIEAENARLPEDKQKPLKPLNQIASVEDTFYSSLRMFAGLDAVGMLRSAWSIGVRGQYERNKHVKIHFDKFDREALEKAFGKNPNSLLRQIVFGNVDGVPAKWFEIDPEAEHEIYKELGRELTPAEKEAYATYGFTELRKVILNKDIPWATRAKIVSVVTGRVVQEPPVAKATIDFVMDSSGTMAKRIIVKSIDLEGNVIQAREFDGQREFEAARSLYEALNDRGWRNNAMLCGDLVIDAIEDKTYADTVDEMAREKGIAPDQFEQMVFGIKQKDITGEKVTYQERQLVDEFDKRHQEKQDAEIKLTGPDKLFEQVAREVFGAEWKQANAIPFKSWGEMTEAEKEFVNKYIERMGAMGVAERNKLMNANPDWVRTAKECEESVRRRMAEAERPAEAEPLPALEDEKVSVETPVEERVEPTPEVIELEEEKPAEPEPVKEETQAEEPVAEEKPDTEGQPQAGTIGFEPVEQPTERERFDAERKEKAATITDADIEANREALGIPEGTALTDEARQIYAEDLAEDLMRYERFKRGESDEKARFHDYWESKFNPKRPKLEKPIEKQEEPEDEVFEEEEATEADALIEQFDNLKGRSDLERYRNALKVFAGDDEIMSILEDLEPHDITEWVSSFLGLDSGKGYSMLWESKTRGGTVIAKGFKEETGWSWNDVKGFAFMFDNKNGMSPRRVAEKIWEELPSGIKDKYSDVDVFNIMMDLFGQSSRKSDLTNYIRNNRMEQVRELLNRRRNNELDEIARYKERERRGDEEPVAPPMSDDEEQNEFAVREDDVAPFSLLSLSYRDEEVASGTIRSRARTRKQLGTIAKALGYKIRWVADKTYNAKIDTDEKVLYVNIRTDRPLESVIGHEITHDLRKSDPKAYEMLKRYAQDLLGRAQWDNEVKDVTDTYNEEYKRRGWQPIRADKAEEEVVCDTMGKVLHTRKGLRELAGSLDTTVAGKVYRLLKDITDKVKSALGKEHDYETMDLALRDFLNAVEQRAKKGSIATIQNTPAEGEATIELSLRRKPAPKKVRKVYKLMRLKMSEDGKTLGEDGKLYPLYIDSGTGLDIKNWYDADSPDFEKLRGLDKGYWLYDLTTGEAEKADKPSKEQIAEADAQGKRYMVIRDVYDDVYDKYNKDKENWEASQRGEKKWKKKKPFTPLTPEQLEKKAVKAQKDAEKRYNDTRRYYNIGLNGSGDVGEYALRPGWHAGSHPTMRQIGKGKNKNLRDDTFVWVEGYVPDDVEYQTEAEGNIDKDIPTHIPTDGHYLMLTNPNAKAAQADRVGWYVAGAFRPERILSDWEARQVIDEWNAEHPNDKIEYDFERESGRVFNAETMQLEEPGSEGTQQGIHRDPSGGYSVTDKADIETIAPRMDGESEAAYNERIAEIGADENAFVDGDGQFSLKRDDRNAPTFYSNAAKAVENVKQEKAKAEQWKAMLTKAGGIKAGEDKWMGLSQWLDEHKGQTLTKEEVAQFVADNGIQMEETYYGEKTGPIELFDSPNSTNEMLVDGHPEYKVTIDGWSHECTITKNGNVIGTVTVETSDDAGKVRNIIAADLGVTMPDEDIRLINQTRLNYTTPGLENKREIAFVVPGVEPYQEGDEVHFGPENQGRAVMWVRFGETTDSDGNRVLVIDEIQSNRHQDAREKGYREDFVQSELDQARQESSSYSTYLFNKYIRGKHPGEDFLDYATDEEKERFWELSNKVSDILKNRYHGVPAAPFEKNWHEVAMKRMLRLAAEEGFDKVAWTTGMQQADRYSLSHAVQSIAFNPEEDGSHSVFVTMQGGTMYEMVVGTDGMIESTRGNMFNGKNAVEIFGKEITDKIMNAEEPAELTGDDLRVGGYGMKSFYDGILPQYMNKYGKKWGVKTGEVTLATPGKEVMHSVDVTPEMRRSVVEQGQPLFSLKRETRTDADGNEVYTETREDGTKDREITTYGDGSKKALWYDDKGNLKERLDYYPNGEVSQVANYDSDGNLTRNIQYDENRRATSYYLPAIGTDWKLDENGIARGKSNGVEIKPYNFQFSLKREAQTHSENFKNWFGDWENDPEHASKVVDKEGKPLVVYHQTNAKRWINRETGEDWEKLDWRKKMEWESRPQEEWEEAWEEQDFYTFDDRYARQSIEMPAIFFSPENDPHHEYGNRTIAVYLNMRNPAINPDIPNRGVTDTAGRDAMEALRAQGYDGFIRTDEDGNIREYGVFDSNQVKSATENNGEFDPNNPDIRFSLKRRRNRDDYTDEDRADAAIIANTYLAQADALRQQIEADREQEHRLVEERNKLLAFDYPAADPADRPAIMDRINALRNQINDLRNANYENNTKLRSMDYEYRVAKEILNQGAVTDEEAARFDAGQMTREEKVLESLFKAAADSRADKKAKQKAVRGLVRELAAITDNFKAAMKARGIESQRKHYDKGTVDHIIRLARAMMGTGYIDNMTSYEVKRLMGMINNAATRESIEEQAGRIVDMMLDHQIRTLRNDFDKQLKVTGQKTNSSGVQVQAGLDQEGQVVMEAMRKSMQIIADSAGERYDSNGYLTEWGEFYENTLNDMGDADPVKAEQARKIFEGVWLASKWYNDVRAMEINGRILRSQMEEFKAKNKPAKDADKDTKQRYNDVLADYQEMLRQNKIKIIEAYERMTGDVGLTQAESVRRAKEFADAQKQRVNEIQHNANSDLADVDDNTQVKTPESRVFGANKNNVLARLLFASAGTYEKFMRFFGRMAPNGEGYLFKRFMTQYHHARQDYWKGRHSAFEEMDKKMAEVFGKKKMHWSDIYEMTRDHKKFPPITVSYWDGYRNGQPYLRVDELNQSEALYLYMINKMPDGRMKLRHMGITDDVVQQMAGQIDRRLITLADWLQGEFLPKMRIKYNETHKRVFGADMAAIEDYFPLRINKLAVASDMDITERDMNDNKPSTITGAIVKRRVNTLPIDLHTDAFDVALSHIDEMEHWSAFAEFNRDNNTLVNYKRFRTKVNNMRSLELGAGNVLWKNFTDAVAIAADAYHPRAGSRSGDHYSTRVAKFVSTAKIALRPYTALKQLLSIPAFWADSDPLEQMKATLNVADTWQWAIENLPGFAERWQSRQAGNIKLANYNDLSGLRRRKAMQRLGRAGMWANAAIDGLACAMGGKAVYETKLKRYRKMGYDEARAQEKALIDAAIAYNNSQQSSEGAYVSPLQVDRTWFANAFSVFRSASMGYTRRLNTSLRQLRNATFKPGYGTQSVEFLKKQMMRDGLTEEQATKWAHRIYRRANLKAAASVAIFGQILPFTWNLGTNMFYLLFGDDDKEKKKILADSFRHSFFGPIEGLVGGNVYSELGDIAADTAIGNIWGDSIWGDSNAFKALGYRDFSTMPLSSDINNVLKYFARDEVKAANEVVNILFQVATGVNPQTITDWVTAILDFSRSDMERRDIAMFAMRLLSTPQQQLDRFYLDQMNLTQEQAAKMSKEDLIKRYATYKRWRETPLTGWMYSDEREKKVEEKFQKRYEEMLEERAVGEDGLRESINTTDDLPSKRTMMRKLQKELSDSIEAADPELYKKALEGEKADDDEYVRHVTDKDVEQMAELAMKKKALRAAYERKLQADKDVEAGRITQEEYDAIYKECAHEWRLYNYLDNKAAKDIKEMKRKMEPGASKHDPEYWMDSIRTYTDKVLRKQPQDMKMKKGDKKHSKKNKNK